MAGRRTRKSRTIDGGLAAMTYDPLGNPTGIDDSLLQSSIGWQATADPDIIKKIVPTGTPGATLDGATTVAVSFPDVVSDTWYKPSNGAYVAGRATAAIDTIQQTAGKLADVGATIANNLMPIVIGIAVLYFFLLHQPARQ